MDTARHSIVEGPDGSIAIAFNVDVLPPELVPEIPLPATNIRPVEIRITGIKFCDKGKSIMCILFYISLFILSYNFTILNIISATFVFITFITVSTGYSIASFQLIIHGIISAICYIVLMINNMWITAVYQLCIALLCMYLQITSKNTFVEVES